MRKNIIIFTSIVTYCFSMGASAERLKLMCEGTRPMYENGFGTTDIDWSTKVKLLVDMDLTQRTVEMMTLFGQKSSTIKYITDDSISFSVPHNNVAFHGVKVIDENVTINRNTGDITSGYTFENNAPDGRSYTAFLGSCVKAEKKF